MGVLMYHDRNYSGTPCWQGTMAEYNALSAHDPNTMYFITDETGSCILWRGTRAMFDALPDDEKDDNTLYIITDEDATIDADNVTYDNTESGLTATDVQSAIDEIAQGGSGGGSAEETTYDNSSSGLEAENVQDAIDEVNDKFDGLPIPMQYKGTIGTGGTIQSLPSPSSDNVGFVYKVITEADYLLSTVYYKIRQYVSSGYWAFEGTKAADENYTEIIKNQIFDPRSGSSGYYDFDDTLSVGRSSSANLIINSLVDGIHYNNNIYNTGDTIYSTTASTQTVTGISYGPSIHAKVGDIFISTGLEWTYIPSGDEANSFAELSDTNISNPTHGQIPIYNSTSGKWENGDSSGGTTVTWDQTQSTGTKIAEIEIDGVPTDVYSPTPIDVEGNPSGSATAGDLTKLKVGESIYSIPSGGGSSETILTQTLTAGNTTLTFTDASITANSLVSIYVNNSAAKPVDLDDSVSGSITLSFNSQSADLIVKLVIK